MQGQLAKNPQNSSLKQKLAIVNKEVTVTHNAYKKEVEKSSLAHRKQGAAIGALLGGISGYQRASRMQAQPHKTKVTYSPLK